MNQTNDVAAMNAAQPYPQQPPQAAYPGYPPYPAPQPPVYAPQPPSFAVRHKDPRKTGAVRTLNRMGLLMVTQLVLSLALSMAAIYGCFLAGINVYADGGAAQVVLSIGLAPLCTAGPMLVYMLAGKKDWNAYFRFERRGFLAGLLVVFAGLGVALAANYPAGLLESLLESLGARKIPSVVGEGGGWPEFIVEFLGLAVLVPVMEEFAFRGVVLSSLRRYGTGFAIVASGLIFGMAHMSIYSAVFAVIAGIAMGAAYVLTGNLWVTVLIHMLNNGIATVQSYAGLLVGPDNAMALQGALLLGFIALGLLCLVLLLVFRRRLFKEGPSLPPADAVQPKLTPGEAAGCIVKSPVIWAIFAMVLVETALLFL